MTNLNNEDLILIRTALRFMAQQYVMMVAARPLPYHDYLDRQANAAVALANRLHDN